jgi:UDP:flavonoid glycosyltransferase YjiC (YdhE family)
VRVEEASPKRLLRALERLLFDPQYRRSARQWATVFGRYDSGVLFRQFLSETLDGGHDSVERPG